MSDLISRQALMKRISEEYHKYGDDYDALQILGDIEDFPSAETPTVSKKYQLSAETSTNTSIDLISRQDAINVLEERLRANGYSNVALVSELNRSIGYLMRLPSATSQNLAKPNNLRKTTDTDGYADQSGLASAT